MIRRQPAALIGVIALAAIALGVGLRCTHVAHKVFWHDEAFTALRVSGYTAEDFAREAFRGEVITRDELLAFQRPPAGLGLTAQLRATARALASRPEHPPLYYLTARVGYLFTDDAVLATRVPAVLWGLLLLPAVYWCWREAFSGHRGALIATSLIAVSPLQVLYAQEARQYSLWTLLTIAATAALLRACRSADRRSWWAYGLLAAAGICTHLQFAAVLAAHATWLIWQRRCYDARALRRLGWSLGFAALVISPWLVLLVHGTEDVARTTAWLRTPTEFARLAYEWGQHVWREFVDLDAKSSRWVAAIAVAVALAVWTAMRAPPTGRLLVLVAAAIAASVLAPDLLFDGRVSLYTRYLLPALACVSMCAAFVVDQSFDQPRRAARLAGTGVWLSLIAAGGVSCVVMWNSHDWWNKRLSKDDESVRQVIREADRPLLVVENDGLNPGLALSLAHELNGQTRFLLVPRGRLPEKEALTGDVLALYPTPALLSLLRQVGTTEFPASQEQVVVVHRSK